MGNIVPSDALRFGKAIAKCVCSMQGHFRSVAAIKVSYNDCRFGGITLPCEARSEISLVQESCSVTHLATTTSMPVVTH